LDPTDFSSTGKTGMWRALFLAIAIAICILGLECLVLERAVLNLPAPTSSGYSLDPNDPLAPPTSQKRTIEATEWHPWSLLCVGSVMMLYSLTLRRGG
jgi:hypothetical protein